MSSGERWLQRVVLSLVSLHGLALLSPGSLWGISHLAVWPRAAALLWIGAAWAGVLAAPSLARRVVVPPFPGWRGATLLAALAGLLFWTLRERTHFGGDGALLIRDLGYSESVTRARLLVLITNGAVRWGRSTFDWDAERTLALLSVGAGMVAVVALLRASRHLGKSDVERWFLAGLVATAGAMQLFFGHVEYYAVLAAALLAVLAVQAPLLGTDRSEWRLSPWRGTLGLALYGLLVPLHLSTLALLPAQMVLWIRAWRLLPRWTVMLALLAIPLLAGGLVLAAGGSLGDLASTSAGGLRRYVSPYFDTASARHASGLLAPAHWLAFANDVLLTAPLVLAGLVCIAAWRRADWRTPACLYLGLASVCSLGFNFFFARELGPFRDWDIMAPYAFVLLMAVGISLISIGAASPVSWIVVVVGGLSHGLPWVFTQASPERAIAHVRLALSAPSQWSPHARGYMHEELAIHFRQQEQTESVLLEYEAAVQANPADARYRVGLGNQLALRGDLDGAARAYERALETRPDYAPAHNNLAYALSQLQRDLDGARGHARRALASAPDNADYWLTLARVEVAAQRPNEARRALERALQLRNPFPEALKLLASLEE